MLIVNFRNENYNEVDRLFRKIIYEKEIKMAKLKTMTDIERMKEEADKIIEEAKKKERAIREKIKQKENAIYLEIGKKAVEFFNKKIGEEELKILLEKYNMLDEVEEKSEDETQNNNENKGMNYGA